MLHFCPSRLCFCLLSTWKSSELDVSRKHRVHCGRGQMFDPAHIEHHPVLHTAVSGFSLNLLFYVPKCNCYFFISICTVSVYQNMRVVAKVIFCWLLVWTIREVVVVFLDCTCILQFSCLHLEELLIAYHAVNTYYCDSTLYYTTWWTCLWFHWAKE